MKVDTSCPKYIFSSYYDILYFFYCGALPTISPHNFVNIFIQLISPSSVPDKCIGLWAFLCVNKKSIFQGKGGVLWRPALLLLRYAADGFVQQSICSSRLLVDCRCHVFNTLHDALPSRRTLSCCKHGNLLFTSLKIYQHIH